MKHNHPKIEIMDTTLRDGEQTSGVSLTGHEKLTIAQLLIDGVRAYCREALGDPTACDAGRDAVAYHVLELIDDEGAPRA